MSASASTMSTSSSAAVSSTQSPSIASTKMAHDSKTAKITEFEEEIRSILAQQSQQNSSTLRQIISDLQEKIIQEFKVKTLDDAPPVIKSRISLLRMQLTFLKNQERVPRKTALSVPEGASSSSNSSSATASSIFIKVANAPHIPPPRSTNIQPYCGGTTVIVDEPTTTCDCLCNPDYGVCRIC